MKITAFNGSPRGKKGNTYIMTEEFLKGASEAGAQVEQVLLAEKKINHCMGCFRCWVKTPGSCFINDDMKPLLKKLIATDVIVFATPLYVDNVTGLMKNFMDRIIPMGDPHIVKDEKGESRHPSRHEKTAKIVVISNCGFPEESHFQVLELLFKRVARNMHSEVIAEIYRGEGELLKQTGPELKPIIDKYKSVLRKAGREIVELSGLSGETIEELKKPLVPHDKYVATANKFFDRIVQ